jgi:hypothetical protein
MRRSRVRSWSLKRSSPGEVLRCWRRSRPGSLSVRRCGCWSRPVGLERLPGTGCLLTSRRWRGVGLYQGQRSRAVVEYLICGVASATATGTPVEFGRGVSRRPDVAAEAAMAASATGYLALVLNDDFEFRRFVVHCACLCLRRPVRSGSGGMLGDRRIRLSPIARWRSGTPWLWPHPWGMAASACCTVAFASC